MRRVIASAFVCLAACSASGGSSGGTGVNGIDAPCGDLGTVLVDGTLGGKTVHETAPLSGFAWVNVGKPSKFDGSWSGGSMHLEWGSTIASGQETDLLSGALNLASTPDPRSFTSGRLVYDSASQATESTLKTALVFDQGTVTVCIRKKS